LEPAAQQEKMIKNFRNAKEKLLKTNAGIWFNKICSINEITPKYILFKIEGENQQSRSTKPAATRYILNQEIKFLYKKKQLLNEHA
jgi:hypothetical protein